MNRDTMDIRLEGFDTEIRGHRVLVIGGAEGWLAKIAMLESNALYKGRSILVIQETGRGQTEINPLLLKHRWDLIVRVKEGFDAQMLATYVNSCPKPCRILWAYTTGQEIPRSLWQRWTKGDVTLIGGTEGSSLGSVEWECIFFPIEADQSVIEKVLNGRATGAYNGFSKLKDHLEDIAASGAALAWSTIDEKTGSLYWYDPSEGVRGDDMYTKKEAKALLESLAHWVSEM
jgi:hypothetical protein